MLNFYKKKYDDDDDDDENDNDEIDLMPHPVLEERQDL